MTERTSIPLLDSDSELDSEDSSHLCKLDELLLHAEADEQIHLRNGKKRNDEIDEEMEKIQEESGKKEVEGIEDDQEGNIIPDKAEGSGWIQDLEGNVYEIVEIETLAQVDKHDEVVIVEGTKHDQDGNKTEDGVEETPDKTEESGWIQDLEENNVVYEMDVEVLDQVHQIDTEAVEQVHERNIDEYDGCAAVAEMISTLGDVDDLHEQESVVCQEECLSKVNRENGNIAEEQSKQKGIGKIKKKKVKARIAREKGDSYVGFRRAEKMKTNIVIQDVKRSSREMGPRCSSKKCIEWSTRQCESVPEADRNAIFQTFWKEMTWEAKKMYICTLVTQQPLDKEKFSGRRSLSYFYHLKVGEKMIPVCKELFLSTFGLNRGSIDRWLKNYFHTHKPGKKSLSPEVPQFDEEETSSLSDNNNDSSAQPSTSAKTNRGSRKEQLKKRRFARKFVQSLPALESHYSRKDSSRLYLQGDIGSVEQLFALYIEECTSSGRQPLSRWTFGEILKNLNFSVFKPRKDQCDTCIAFKNKQMAKEKYEKHVTRKDQARLQKTMDKESAERKECHTLCCDLMNVQCLPMLKASSAYYKLKMTTHNFTIYNLETHDAQNYWFEETVATLEASTFASCLVHYCEELLTKDFRPSIIIFSDGCSYQNRNAIMSNALLHLSVKYQVKIVQKYLEKGHTQMEGDSVHATVERAISKQEVYLPSNLMTLTVLARKEPFPYRAFWLRPDFVLDYSEDMVYKSIRPGANRPHEPVVNDLRVLEYDGGFVNFKINFNDELQPLPGRPLKKLIREKPFNFKPKRTSLLQLPYDKWQDLQDLKPLMPPDCHHYYDNLPFNSESLRQKKRAEKRAAQQPGDNKSCKKKSKRASTSRTQQ